MTYTVSQVTESIGTITLDHERRRNALSHALVEEVIAALRSFQEAKVRVVILRAKPGAKVFSAGHDIDELPESRRDPLGWDDPLRQLVREIENYPGPVIAMVEGSVWGGATETVFACDLIVAAETAAFPATPAKLGLPYNVGGMLTFLNATGLRMAVIPTGYSFNLDGTNIYMTLATLFLAQAVGADLSIGRYATIILVAMLTSKGASGVTGAGFITLAATLAAIPNNPVPVAAMTLVLGIDKFMSECRALTNLVGNGVATVVVSAWENELDRNKLRNMLAHPGRSGTAAEAEPLDQVI